MTSTTPPHRHAIGITRREMLQVGYSGLLGLSAPAIFAPAARVARKLSDTLSVGVEYYTDLGPLENFLPFNEQQHNIYAVVDFKVGRFDVNAGVGYGLTPGSDRLMAKIIIGTDLNEGEPSKSTPAPKSFRKAVNGLPHP